ncbi:MAG: lipoate--protein ligase family protein [Candidatus Omnitrophica bacterium]|nr:lipoate--protein ligase family protein [Candidatus Omnitrophota bacterium]
MLVKDISLPTPHENILYDEALLYLAEQEGSGEVLRFWESPELFIVLGRTSKEEEDLCIDKITQDQIPVVRRSSGGGTVVQGKGCLNYSLILSKTRDPRMADLRLSYHVILHKVIAALNACGVKAVFYPVSDIALADSQKKISGNAQKRCKEFILHHGTILYDFNLESIKRYLKIPRDIPEYRQGRPHMDFVGNLPLPAGPIKDAIKNVFGTSREEKRLKEKEEKYLQRFLETKNIYVKQTG